MHKTRNSKIETYTIEHGEKLGIKTKIRDRTYVILLEIKLESLKENRAGENEMMTHKNKQDINKYNLRRHARVPNNNWPQDCCGRWRLQICPKHEAIRGEEPCVPGSRETTTSVMRGWC